MKSISVQYQELKEGRITQHQFLRNARMLFPNYVTNHNSFEDSVKILKNRGLLNEGDAVKGTPDKAPSYDYPTQPAKYKKVVQKPEVDEQDGIYPATTLTDIPKEEVSKPIKSKNRPDGLEPAKDKDKKNEMKKIRIVKESKKSLTELSPQARNYAAMAAATRSDDDKNVSKLYQTKFDRNYGTLTELPKNLQDQGKNLAGEIQKSLFPDSGGTSLNYELKKVIPSMSNAKIDPPFIRYNVYVLDKDKRRQSSVLYTIYKDRFEEGNDNVRLNSSLNSKVLKFVNDLKKELETEFKKVNELGPAAQQMAGNPEEERASRITMIRRRRDNDKDAEIEAMIARAKREKEEEEGLEGGFGIYDLEEADTSSGVVNTPDEQNFERKLKQSSLLMQALNLINMAGELDGLFALILNSTKLDNISKQQIITALRRALDQDGKDSNFTADAAEKPKPASTNPIDQARQGLRSAGVNPNDSKNKLREVIKKLVNEALNEYEKGDENDKAPSIKEATKDIIDIMVKKLKNEESFKKSELDDVFSKYESTAGKRYKNSVFQDVISGLKTKGYKIKYK
jgi:hypothetical protein